MIKQSRWVRVTVVWISVALAPCSGFGQGADRGIELFTQGNYPASIDALKAHLLDIPDDADARYLLGIAHQQLGQHAQAADVLRAILADDGNYVDALLPLGISAFETQQFAEAERSLLRAVEVDENDASAWMFLGLTQTAVGKHSESIDSFRRASALDPELRQSALLNIGLAQQQLGQRSASREALRTAIDVNPGSDIANTAYGLLGETIASTTSARPWALSARAGIEYDDNVTTSELDATTGEDDTAAIFELSAAYLPYRTEQSEIEIGYDFYQSLYSDLSDFDLQLHTIYALGSHEFDLVDGGTGYRFTHATLGGDSFFDIHGIRPNVGFNSTDKLFHSIAYSYQNKNFDSDDDRDADQHGVSIDTYYFLGTGTYTYAGFRLEDENTDGDQFDYFAYYASLGAAGIISPFPHRPTRVRFGYRYYLRDYESVTESIGREREDQRHSVTLSLKQPLTRYFSAILDYQYIASDSNLQASDFTENVLTLSLEFSL